MRCPKCGEGDTRVIDSRLQDATNAVKRRRECCKCGHRFTTFERCEDPIEVIKRNGDKEPFNRGKLLAGLTRATNKREYKVQEINELIDDIESELRSRNKTSVTSAEIGDMVLRRLEKIDKVAYIRFASIYQDFQTVDEFITLLNDLR
ncbi:MAG: transcriptional regulator NrdR [Coriobacteriaceae bacterium]|nr:transcriptional regulator NrdR [Coriobacteriaceae bacterium]